MANAERHAVKGNASNFESLLGLSQEFAKVCVVNEKRHMLSVEGMTDDLAGKLKEAGGKVYKEIRFDLE
jgi:hypothetical protein